MEEMGDDEVMAMMGSLCIGLFAAGAWYLRGLRISALGGSSSARMLLLLAPLLGLGLLEAALASYSAVEVRTDTRYQFLFVAMGLVWVFLLPQALSLVGVSYRDDALERRNVPAAIAIGGTVVGLAVLFTGSNMGEGPSIWNTVATAVAATSLLFGAVLVLAQTTRFGDAIAIERDVASGLRFAGWIVASGVVLARASAGDWVSTEAMWSDLFSHGWPVAVFLAIAIGLEITLRPSDARPQPSPLMAGLVPAAGYLVVSLAYVAALPSWHH